jgi:sterol 3beta-glucosyltransferase
VGEGNPKGTGLSLFRIKNNMTLLQVIFKAQNNGESVKIGIPYSVIVDVERSSALGFSETIEVKVLDSEDHLSLESYFFAYFHDINDALQQIRDILSSHRHETEQTAAVKDTTMKSHTRPTSQDFEALERTQSSPLPAVQRSSRIGTFFKAFANESAPAMVHNTSAPEVPTAKDNGKTAELADITTSPSMLSSELSSSSFDHTYPPSPSPPAMELHQDTSWGVSVPSWLKGSSLKSLAARSLPTLIRGRNGQVSEVYTASPAPMDPENSREFTVIDAQPDTGVDPDDEEKFRHAFAMDERETLLECMFNPRCCKPY